MADMEQYSENGSGFSSTRLAVQMGRAFSPQEHYRFQPGALPQADMDRASGPLEIGQTVNPQLKERTKAPMDPIVSSHVEVRTKAPKARTITAWGSAPGTVDAKKNKGCKPVPSL